jgi:RNA recognition motif. (a.k.a. RRM, RBD, or RNP domain)
MTSSMPSLSNGTSIDWYGQMPQMAYNSQMAKVHTQSHSQQSMSYDQHMLGLGSPQQRHTTNPSQNQNQSQGSVYMRSPGFVEDASYSPGITIVIGFLPQHADVALLHDLCAPYGRIISAQIDMDNLSPDDNSRGGCSGRGRVQMASLSQAQYATQALNGAIIFEGGRPLQVRSQLKLFLPNPTAFSTSIYHSMICIA